MSLLCSKVDPRAGAGGVLLVLGLGDFVDQDLDHGPEHERDPGDGQGQGQDVADPDTANAGLAHERYVGRKLKTFR